MFSKMMEEVLKGIEEVQDRIKIAQTAKTEADKSKATPEALLSKQ